MYIVVVVVVVVFAVVVYISLLVWLGLLSQVVVDVLRFKECSAANNVLIRKFLKQSVGLQRKKR